MLALLAARVAAAGGRGAAAAAIEGSPLGASLPSRWLVAAATEPGSAATAARQAPLATAVAAAASAPRLFASSSAATEPSTTTTTPPPLTTWPSHLPAELDTPAARAELALRDAQRQAALERRAARPDARYRAELVAFNRARAAWRREVAGLRQQWASEHREASATRERRAAAARREAARLRAAREAACEQVRADAALGRELRAAERAVAAAEQRLAAAQRDAIRGNVLAHYRAQQREAVLEASRAWVPPDELAARVKAALERPERL
jgi:hypothetical protein